MALITKVKASSISSLSDARYFAGMGVDWLGFDVNPQSPNYVSLNLYKDIVGWVSGPKRVIEVSQAQIENLNQLIEAYQPDHIQVDIASFPLVLNQSLIISLQVTDIEKITFIDKSNIECVILNGELTPDYFDAAEKLSSTFKVLISVPPKVDINMLNEQLPKVGIELKGSTETQVGVKTYHYSDLLEKLTDDFM